MKGWAPMYVSGCSAVLSDGKCAVAFKFKLVSFPAALIKANPKAARVI